MSIPGAANPLLLRTAAAAGYTVSRSLRFNASDSAYLSRTPSSAGNRKTWTWAGWVKRSSLGTLQFLMATPLANNTQIYFDTNNTLVCGDQTYYAITNAVLRDCSAWYHIVIAVNTTLATASDRIKIYLNGTEASVSAGYPTQNYDFAFNQTIEHNIGRRTDGFYFPGYLADIHFIDGQALTPSSFTETSATTGQLIPKKYTGTFTGNSFWLQFADNSAATATTLGKDSSGLGNNWTPNNLSVTAGAGNDSLVDTPSSAGTDSGLGGQVTGNYATLNPLDKGSGPTLANGNLDVTGTAGVVRGTMFMPSGKWYFEGTLTALGSSGNNTPRFGVANAAEPIATSDAGSSNNVASIICSPNATFGGRGIRGGTTVGTGNPFAAGDVAMVAYDADTGNIWFGKNGTWINSGNPATGASPTFTGLTAPYAPLAQADTVGFNCNFGQRPFAYTAPSGFKALCDTNLPTPVVAKPSTVFDTKLYTGNGSTQNITGLGFSPDLVWIKERNSAENHQLQDTVRGATNRLFSNLTAAESADAGSLTSFNSDGFSLGNAGNYNGLNDTYVAWCWDAGSSTVTNTAGSITSQVRANASAGFSIVTYTGTGSTATVGHGLGASPGLVIVKDRGISIEWVVYHSALGSSDVLLLNATNAKTTISGYWGTPGSSTFGLLGGSYSHNRNGNSYVAYCFAPVSGYSSMGSFVGNGSTDGPFVFTGMRPRWILLKDSTNVANWELIDTARIGYNGANYRLYPNLSDAETADNRVDILSNGFKIRTGAGTAINTSNAVVVYAAFAENPFQYARAR